MKTFLIVFIWFFFVVYVAFAVVQYNDPDPFLWIVVYLYAGLLGLAARYTRFPRFLFGLSALAYLVFAMIQWPPVWEGIGESMITKNMERAREALGLLICTFTTTVYFVFLPKINRKLFKQM